MKKFLLLVFALLWMPVLVLATHQRAGEISFKYLSPLTYEVTIVTYSYAPSPADRFELELFWGDGTSTVLKRNNGPLNQLGLHVGEIVGTDIKKNLYTGVHTYAGAATYKLTLEDPNRNYGIQNIPNSVEVPLFLETQLVINPFVGNNSSPQLLLPPIDLGCVNQPYLHNPGAYDPDGDSLSFVLTTCRGAKGEKIPGFVLPNQVGTNVGGKFIMNPRTGEIRWEDPRMQGEYNIAYLVEEWRNGVRIGYMTRDMQITIVTCDNNPPTIQPVQDTCVEAGSALSLRVSATDPDNNKIRLTATGAPFEIINPATFITNGDSVARNSGVFNWQTTCGHVSKNSYMVYIKAVDDDLPVNLYDLKTLMVRVIGPSPKNLKANPLGNAIILNWDANACPNVAGYNIYRRNGSYGFKSGYCEPGVPAYTGYQLVGTLKTPLLTYTDNDLSRGIEYCYMVVAIYPDGAESFASNEACAQLKKDVPVITHVSVLNTDASAGSMYLAWSKPTELDIVQAPGPYKYVILRAQGIDGNTFVPVDSLALLNDTIFTDKPLNTTTAYSYRIDFYNDTPGRRFFIGSSQKASSVLLSPVPGDRKVRLSFNVNVPWTNTQYVIYRLNNSTSVFDSIGKANTASYTNSDLENGETYCYKALAIGTYGTAGIADPLLNWSQEACAVPVDNEAPCAPVLTVAPDCDHSANVLTIENKQENCADDIVRYRIFYRPPLTETFALLDSTATLTYTHSRLSTIAGCYSVQAIDHVGNRSVLSDTLCIDSDACGKYRLPNVFTPNGDEQNDMFRPFPYSSVEKIDLKIFNRWGRVIFATQDPDIKWDGKIQNTNTIAADGVYYYVCDVYEISLEGSQKRTIRGSITILH